MKHQKKLNEHSWSKYVEDEIRNRKCNEAIRILIENGVEVRKVVEIKGMADWPGITQIMVSK